MKASTFIEISTLVCSGVAIILWAFKNRPKKLSVNDPPREWKQPPPPPPAPKPNPAIAYKGFFVERMPNPYNGQLYTVTRIKNLFGCINDAEFYCNTEEDAKTLIDAWCEENNVDQT